MYLQIKNNRYAFSLIEMLVVLLILTVVTAAFLPIMTRRGLLGSGGSSSASDFWKEIDPGGDIYYGTSDAQGVAIGTGDFGSYETMLLINSADKNQSQILTQINSLNSGIIKLDADENYAVGKNTLNSNSTGVSNTAFGIDVLNNNTSGSYNSVLGYNSLVANVTGNRNTLAGSYADPTSTGSNDNTILGDAGLYVNVSASENTGVGCATFLSLESGIGNTALAVIGMEFQNSASYNTTVGWGALNRSSEVPYAVEYSTAIGQSSCQYTNGSYYNSCLGYQTGTVGPYALSIGSGSSANARSTAIGGWTNSSDKMYLGQNDSLYLYRMPGKFKIGTLDAGSGTALFSNAGLVSVSSDRRLKNIVGPFNSGLEKIRELKPYKYTFKSDENKSNRVDVVAQDLQKVFPNSVTKDDEGYLMIQKEEMFYSMVNSIKQLDIITKNLMSKVQELLIRRQNLENKIAALVNVNKIHLKKIKEIESRSKSIEVSLNKLEKELIK